MSRRSFESHLDPLSAFLIKLIRVRQENYCAALNSFIVGFAVTFAVVAVDHDYSDIYL